MTYTLGALLTTTLTCVGLAALGAARPGRWASLRWLAFLAIICPPLLVEADEVVVGFAVQGATVAIGVWLARWWRQRGEPDARPLWAFSLSGLLTLTAAVALAAAMVSRWEFRHDQEWGDVPSFGDHLTHYYAWGDFALIGGCAGFCTMLGAWIAVGKRLGWQGRALIAVGGGLLAALPLFVWDEFSTSLRHGMWPQPQYQIFLSPERYVPGSERCLRHAWMPVCVAIVLLVGAMVGLLRAVRQSSAPWPLGWATRLAVAGLTVALLTPPAWVGWQLLLPWRSAEPPPPPQETPVVDRVPLPAEVSQPLALMKQRADAARGGTQHDYGESMKGFYGALARLYPSRRTLDEGGLRAVIARLRSIEAAIEPFAAYRRRSIIDLHQRSKWHRRLREIICRWDQHHFVISGSGYPEEYYASSRAMLALFTVEFALHAHRAEHGEWPKSLAQLTPFHIPTVPVDPCSPTGEALRYSPTAEGYSLYSVGNNGLDDGGVPPERVRRWVGWRHHTGDISLPGWFGNGER